MRRRLVICAAACVRSEIYFEFAKVASEEQLARFEQYKRSKFPRAAMRRLMHDIVGTSSERCSIILVRPPSRLPARHPPARPPSARPPPPSRPPHLQQLAPSDRGGCPTLAQASLAKSYIGELVETARVAAGSAPPRQIRPVAHPCNSGQRPGAAVAPGRLPCPCSDGLSAAAPTQEAMTAAGETGPLQPRHIRAAQRQAQRSGTVPPCPIHKRRLFWRTDCGA